MQAAFYPESNKKTCHPVPGALCWMQQACAFPANTDAPQYLRTAGTFRDILSATPLVAKCILPFMKILIIDNDSKRISTLKSLEFNGHLVQSVETLSEVRRFLDTSVCQRLILGPEQISGDPLKTFSEWRQSLEEKTSPWVVALGPRQDAAAGIDHFVPIPIDEIDVVELPGLRGVPPEPEAMDHNAALEICDGDEDLLREIAGIFLKEGPKRIEKLTQALEEKDWKAVREAAHLIKGSALNLAAGSLRTATQNLEQAGAAGNTPLILFWFDQVVYEYGRLENHLKGLVGGSAGLS